MGDGEIDFRGGGRFWRIGGPIDRSLVSFIIYGDDLDPDEISKLLQLSPTRTHRKGDLRRSRGRVSTFRYRTGMWLLEGDLPGSVPLELQLADLVGVLAPKASACRDLAGRGYELTFSCGCFLEHMNRGADILPHAIKGIAELTAGLGLDIYCASSEPEEVSWPPGH